MVTNPNHADGGERPTLTEESQSSEVLDSEFKEKEESPMEKVISDDRPSENQKQAMTVAQEPPARNTSLGSSTQEPPSSPHPQTVSRHQDNESRRNARSMISSIVVRQHAEETLETLQNNLLYGSEELLRSLGDFLSQSPSPGRQRPASGISLPASAIDWLATQISEDGPSNVPSGQNNPTATSTTMIQASTQGPYTLSRVQAMLPRLSHLRVTADRWPKNSYRKDHTAQETIRSTTTSSNSNRANVYGQHQTLQAFHRLRYSPRVDMHLFSNLKVLLLDQVPPDWIIHLHAVQATLQVLRVERACLYDLETFLLGNSERNDNRKFQEFSALTHLKLSHCNLGEMTRGLAHPRSVQEDGASGNFPLSKMPKLTSLSMSHNDIRSEGTAIGCGITNSPDLSHLDLSYNQIPSFRKAALNVANLKTLILTGNCIKSANGIDQLIALETLAMDYNRIRSWVDIAGLARLPLLKTLKLAGNPLVEKAAARKNVRVMLLDLFRVQRWGSLGDNGATFRQLESILPVIDGKPASSRELKALQQRAFVPVVTATAAVNAIAVGEEAPISKIQIEQSASTETNNVSPIACSLRSRRKKKRRRRVLRATIHDPLGVSGDDLASGHMSLPLEKGLCEGSTTKKLLRLPKVAFTIDDVILSLQASDGRATMNSGEEEKVNHVWNSKGTDAGAKILSNADNAGRTQIPAVSVATSEAAFAWPQPISYVPENNLYGEFEWNPPVAFSLGDQKTAKPKQKRMKTKTKKNGGKATSTKKAKGSTESGKQSGRNAQAFSKVSTFEVTKTQIDNSTSTEICKQKKATNVIATTGKKTSPCKVPISEEVTGPAATLSQRDEKANTEGAEPRTRQLDLTENGSSGQKSFGFRVVSDEEDGDDMISPNSITGAAFPELAMDFGGVDDATFCSLGTSYKDKTSSDAKPMTLFRQAEFRSKFVGVEQERDLNVVGNLELYFKTFVFPQFLPDIDAAEGTWQSIFFRYPRIQLLQRDRETRDNTNASVNGGSVQLQSIGKPEQREKFVRVWKEDVIACGKPTLRRLQPNRTAHFGFHGDLSWLDGKVKTVSEYRQVILCLSNSSLYVILDNDSVTAKEQQPISTTTDGAAAPIQPDGQAPSRASACSIDASSKPPTQKKRKFPSPLTETAAFKDAMWPHAVACHPLTSIYSISLGFGLQRLTIRVRNLAYPSAVDFTYILLTSNKMRTVELLQQLQRLVREAKMGTDGDGLTEDPIKIDNDDKQFLDGLASAVAPQPLGAVMHYQILKQRWKHGQRGAVSRVCIVTDSKVFLLDEDYVGDGSVSVEADSGRRLGAPVLRLINSADLQQIVEVRAADADPNAITIVVRPAKKIQRTQRWRLLCRDRTGAEKLVEDVRKAMTIADCE